MNASEAKLPESALGSEFDWLACDQDGHVALFSTAGAGYAPPEFLEDADAHERTLDALLDGPRTTTPVFAPSFAPEVVNTWKLVAERGLYAFDSDANGGPYRMLAAPATPVALRDLAPDAVHVISRIRLPLRFHECAILSAARLSTRSSSP